MFISISSCLPLLQKFVGNLKSPAFMNIMDNWVAAASRLQLPCIWFYSFWSDIVRNLQRSSPRHHGSNLVACPRHWNWISFGWLSPVKETLWSHFYVTWFEFRGGWKRGLQSCHCFGRVWRNRQSGWSSQDLHACSYIRGSFKLCLIL